jgi:hypothetical protein
MVPVHQTKFQSGGVHGNCLAAAIASILEIPLAAVPQWEEMFGGGRPSVWLNSFHNFLAGYGLQREIHQQDPMIDDYYLAIGPSPRSTPETPFDHCAIYRAGRFVHDPYPGGIGIEHPTEFMVFVPRFSVETVLGEIVAGPGT